jgi:hypothetical protein
MVKITFLRSFISTFFIKNKAAAICHQDVTNLQLSISADCEAMNKSGISIDTVFAYHVTAINYFFVKTNVYTVFFFS